MTTDIKSIKNNINIIGFFESPLFQNDVLNKSIKTQTVTKTRKTQRTIRYEFKNIITESIINNLSINTLNTLIFVIYQCYEIFYKEFETHVNTNKSYYNITQNIKLELLLTGGLALNIIFRDFFKNTSYKKIFPIIDENSQYFKKSDIDLHIYPNFPISEGSLLMEDIIKTNMLLLNFSKHILYQNINDIFDFNSTKFFYTIIYDINNYLNKHTTNTSVIGIKYDNIIYNKFNITTEEFKNVYKRKKWFNMQNDSSTKNPFYSTPKNPLKIINKFEELDDDTLQTNIIDTYNVLSYISEFETSYINDIQNHTNTVFSVIVNKRIKVTNNEVFSLQRLMLNFELYMLKKTQTPTSSTSPTKNIYTLQPSTSLTENTSSTSPTKNIYTLQPSTSPIENTSNTPISQTSTTSTENTQTSTQFMQNTEISKKYYSITAPAEIYDISITYLSNKKYFLFEKKSIELTYKREKINFDVNINTIDFFISDIFELLFDLYEVMFEEPKYEKRIYRLLTLILMKIINENQLELKNIFSKYDPLDNIYNFILANCNTNSPINYFYKLVTSITKNIENYKGNESSNFNRIYNIIKNFIIKMVTLL